VITFRPLTLLAALLLGPLIAPAQSAFDPAAVLAARARKDEAMRDSATSPFNHEPKVAFHPLKYFPPDAGWVFRSKLMVYPEQTPVTILDTKGRQRSGVIHGFLTFTRAGRTHTLRVYRMTTAGGGFYHAVWFTDHTTGDSTYEVGRYIDFEKVDDPAHEYTIDFNTAYNPYCAYSSAYGCAIPRREDRLDLAVPAGEKKWHD
jgi:uncharacterized protein (DUF1684 family)